MASLQSAPRTFADFNKNFRAHYRDTYATGAGADYSSYEPAYRHGYRYGNDEEYAGRSYADLEPEMRTAYDEDRGRGTYEQHSDAVRHAFDRSRSHTDEDVSVEGPAGSSETASGDPGSVMREGGLDAKK